MWQSLPYITSALTLVAFIAAAAAYSYSRRLTSRERQIAAATERDRANLVRDTLEFFHVDTANLTKERQYQIALEQIRARSRRFMTSAIVGCVLCLAFLSLAAYAIYGTAPGNNKVAALQQRNVAFLLGYDAAFALARKRMGENIDQLRAGLDQRIKILGVDGLSFPENPMGEMADAVPAADFARKASGALEAKDPKLAKAFQLGWVGVISTNTPSLPFPGFSVRAFAREVGYAVPDGKTDMAILEQIASIARSAQ